MCSPSHFDVKALTANDRFCAQYVAAMRTTDQIIEEIRGLVEQQLSRVEDHLSPELLFECALRKRRIDALLTQLRNGVSEPHLAGTAQFGPFWN